MFYLAAFIFGSIVGSFLNVCIWRLPRGESIAWPPSHCINCQKPIHWYDNIPLVSFFLLRGRCRQCKARISRQYWVVEFLSALFFVLFYQVFGWTPQGILYLLFALGFLVLSVIDLRHYILPDSLTIPGIVIGLAASSVWPWMHGQEVWVRGLLSSAIGVVVGGGILWAAGSIAEWILKKEAMGGGDVKLLAAIGAVVGWPGVLWTLMVGSCIGSVYGIYQRVARGEALIPFGPFLAAGAFLYFFVGEASIEAYLRLIGLR